MPALVAYWPEYSDSVCLWDAAENVTKFSTLASRLRVYLTGQGPTPVLKWAPYARGGGNIRDNVAASIENAEAWCIANGYGPAEDW